MCTIAQIPYCCYSSIINTQGFLSYFISQQPKRDFNLDIPNGTYTRYVFYIDAFGQFQPSYYRKQSFIRHFTIRPCFYCNKFYSTLINLTSQNLQSQISNNLRCEQACQIYEGRLQFISQHPKRAFMSIYQQVQRLTFSLSGKYKSYYCYSYIFRK